MLALDLMMTNFGNINIWNDYNLLINKKRGHVTICWYRLNKSPHILADMWFVINMNEERITPTTFRGDMDILDKLLGEV